MLKKMGAFTLIFVIIAIAILLYSTNIDKFIDLNNIGKSHNDISFWINENVITAYLGYFLLFYILDTVNFPLAITIPILGGYFLPYPIAITIATIALTLAFLTKYLFFYCLFILYKPNKWLTPGIDKLVTHFKSHKFSYFLTMRFIPIFPGWIVTMLAVRSGINFASYALWTLLGTAPVIMLYAYFGKTLIENFNQGYHSWGQLLAQKNVYLPLLIIGALSLLPLLRRKKAPSFIPKL